MDWKTLVTAFTTIFLAELGDKTQLANLSLTAKTNSWLSVLLGSIIAFTAVTLITVSCGGILNKLLKPEYIRYGAASLFVIIGALMFLGKI